MIQEMALTGTHNFVIKLLQDEGILNKQTCAVDIGAGKGALSSKLKASGVSVSACDVVPEHFQLPGVECRKCDESGVLPFDDKQFDVAIAVEVLEHIDGHDKFFSEVARILKPDGMLLFTTPNILSLKSRLKFLFTGYFYSFDILTPFTKDVVLQHISPFTLNRYSWMLSQHRFDVSRIATDKMQRTSLMLSFLAPIIWLRNLRQSQRHSYAKTQNSSTALFGRTLAIIAHKTNRETPANPKKES